MKIFGFAAAVSALGLCLAGAALAESNEKVSEEFAAHEGRHGFSAEDFAAFTDARIAGLKAGLKLTAAQEKNWPALETALREMAAARTARMEAMRSQMKEGHADRDALDMLRRRATMLSTRAAELNKLADAGKPLYDSLDDAQKARFGVLLREAGGTPRFFHRFGHRHGRGD